MTMCQKPVRKLSTMCHSHTNYSNYMQTVSDATSTLKCLI